MAEFWHSLLSQGQLQTGLELLATALALCYTVLAIRHSLWCWPAALLSTLLTVHIMLQTNLLSHALLQLYYAGMAIYGWWHWRQLHGESAIAKPVIEWSRSRHLQLIMVTACLGLLFGYLMRRYTNTEMAYLDALISAFSVLGTYLTAQKVVSNWLYWVVIDVISVYMFVAQGLFFFAALFVIYTVIAASGYLTWRHNFRQQQMNSGSGIFASG